MAESRTGCMRAGLAEQSTSILGVMCHRYFSLSIRFHDTLLYTLRGIELALPAATVSISLLFIRLG